MDDDVYDVVPREVKAVKIIIQGKSEVGQGAMIGGQAEVVSSNDSQIEVRYHGEIWHAVSAQPLQSGQQVIIEDIEGLTLQVAPLPQPALGESSK